MNWRLVAPLTVVAVCGLPFAASAASDDQPAGMERMQHWAADREAVLEAKLIGMKAGLKLTADQEKLWGPFESAVRDSAKMRMDAMQEMMEARDHGERMSPVDRLGAMADHLAKAAGSLKTIADAAKPLYDSLDDSQKHSLARLDEC